MRRCAGKTSLFVNFLAPLVERWQNVDATFLVVSLVVSLRCVACCAHEVVDNPAVCRPTLLATVKILTTLLILDLLLHFLVERPLSVHQLPLTLTAFIQVWRSRGVCSDVQVLRSSGVCSDEGVRGLARLRLNRLAWYA